MGEITYLDAVRAALADALRDDERVFLLGEDIGHFGGAFGATAGLQDEFGVARVIDTPISEEGFVGAAIGAAWMGERPVVELQFADFVTLPVRHDRHGRGEDPLAQRHRAPARDPHAVGRRRPRRARSTPARPKAGSWASPGSRSSARERSRTPTGCCAPRSTIPIPVLVFEHKGLYRRLKDEAPPAGHRTPIGRARVARAGADATVVTYGSGVTTALAAVDALGADVEVVDLRTVWPLDREAVLASVAKTSRLLVLQEAARSTGVAGLVLSLVAREAFEQLDAPPALHAPPDTPVPFAPELEDAYLPSPESTARALEELLAY